MPATAIDRLAGGPVPQCVLVECYCMRQALGNVVPACQCRKDDLWVLSNTAEFRGGGFAPGQPGDRSPTRMASEWLPVFLASLSCPVADSKDCFACCIALSLGHERQF